MKKIGKNLLAPIIGVLLLSGFILPTQENPIFQEIFGKLITYSINEGPEKVYLQTDKNYYSNEETIWFKTYLLDGISHTASTKSKVVYVALLNEHDSTIIQRKLYTDELGAAGDIALGEEIAQGNYTLRSYTTYMLNEREPMFFEKDIPIWVQSTSKKDSFPKWPNAESQKEIKVESQKIRRPVLKFFPEGGNLVSGTKNVMGIEATDTKGNTINLLGRITDEDGNTITVFKTYDFGLGRTSFIPEIGKKYFASVIVDSVAEKYPLPQAMEKGFVLNAKNNGDHILLNIFTNRDESLEGTLLLGHLRGDVFYKHIETGNNTKSYTIKLLTDKLKDGVAQFTLFTASGEPVCERLVFIDNPDNDLALTIATDRQNYGTREEVAVALTLEDVNGAPVQGDFSMSVVASNSILEGNQKVSDIKSWLLLDSDLGGTIGNPYYFFKDDSNSRKHLLDVLMLTHGWRRFVWQEFMNTNVSKTMTYAPEKGIMINGNTTAFKNRYQPKQTLTTLNIFNDGVYQEKKLTNFQGHFSYGPFSFQDSIVATIEAIAPKGGKGEDFAIYASPSTPKIGISKNTRGKKSIRTITYPEKYLAEAYRKKVSDFKYDPDVTVLKEVVVTTKRKTEQEVFHEEINSMTMYGDVGRRVFPDSIYGLDFGSAIDILRVVPGVRVGGTYPYQTINIRGGAGSSPILPNAGAESSGTLESRTESGPLLLLDGLPVSITTIQQMTSSEILFVDVLKGPETGIYGARGSHGVVAFYTNRQLLSTMTPKKVPGVIDLKIPGFYKTREFYAPDYDRSKPEHNKPDYRTTLHWEPYIALDDKGGSTIRFHTGDSAGDYIITIEGVTTDGRPVHSTHSFSIGLSE